MITGEIVNKFIGSDRAKGISDGYCLMDNLLNWAIQKGYITLTMPDASESESHDTLSPADTERYVSREEFKELSLRQASDHARIVRMEKEMDALENVTREVTPAPTAMPTYVSREEFEELKERVNAILACPGIKKAIKKTRDKMGYSWF